MDGVKTNIEFLLWALDEKGFVDGTYDTTYIERHFSPDHLHSREDELELAAIVGGITAFRSLQRLSVGRGPDVAENTWRRVARTEGLRKAKNVIRPFRRHYCLKSRGRA